MKKTQNATVSKTLMVYLNPGVTGKITEQRLKGLPSVFKIYLSTFILISIYIYLASLDIDIDR